MTTVSEAILSRRSIRAFLDKPVAPDLITKIITQSARAPSGGNLQPWYIDVVTGDSHKKLLDLIDKKIADNPTEESRDYDFYPGDLPDKFTNRRRATGAGLYDAMGIAYDDKQARWDAMKLNWEFFGAPVGLFFSIDKFMGKNQWCHLGMMMQNISLLAIENGLATCMQEAWAVYSETMHEFLNLPEERVFYCGMALGYEDKNAPVNKFVTEREKLAEFVSFID